MSTVREELAYWAAAARGAIDWHLEAGETELPIEADFRFPPLGRMALVPLPEGVEPTERVVVSAPASVRPADIEPPREEVVARLRHGIEGEAPTETPAQTPAQTPAPAEHPVVAPSMPEGARPAAAAALRVIEDELGDCQRCQLGQGRQELVFGEGDPQARVMFVGEAPGATEDGLGLPFADASGQLLSKMIRAMGLTRRSVYLAYVVKCRPGGEIAADTVTSCQPFLERQVQVVKPEIIVALGGFAARALLGSDRAMPRMRGEWAEHQGIAVLPTFHPVAVVQNPQLKAPVWADLRKVMRRLATP